MGFRGVSVGLCGLVAMLAATAGQSEKSNEGPKYDPGTVVEFLATVMDVQEAPQDSPMSGIHLTVKAGSENLDAYLGPTAFLKEFEVTFAKGDRVQLTGSKVKWGRGQIILAREIRKEGTTVYLRDNQGKPYWATS
jgi:hypothetical protein